jgi:hypothetical protein
MPQGRGGCARRGLCSCEDAIGAYKAIVMYGLVPTGYLDEVLSSLVMLDVNSWRIFQVTLCGLPSPNRFHVLLLPP